MITKRVLITETEMQIYNGIDAIPYSIELDRMFPDDQPMWLDHLREKNWFDDELEHAFLVVYYRQAQHRFNKGTKNE